VRAGPGGLRASAAANRRERRAAEATKAAATALSQPRRHARHPGQRQVLDVELIDLLQRAVTLARVIARVGQPRIRHWVEDVGGIQVLPNGGTRIMTQ